MNHQEQLSDKQSSLVEHELRSIFFAKQYPYFNCLRVFTNLQYSFALHFLNHTSQYIGSCSTDLLCSSAISSSVSKCLHHASWIKKHTTKSVLNEGIFNLEISLCFILNKVKRMQDYLKQLPSCCKIPNWCFIWAFWSLDTRYNFTQSASLFICRLLKSKQNFLIYCFSSTTDILKNIYPVFKADVQIIFEHILKINFFWLKIFAKFDRCNALLNWEIIY